MWCPEQNFVNQPLLSLVILMILGLDGCWSALATPRSKKNEKFFLALASCFSYVHSRRSYIGRCRNRDTGPGPRKTRSIVLYEHTRTP